MLWEEDIQKYKNQLTCLWYMIELWYVIELDKNKLLENIEWIREKADIYWYRLVDWSYDWNSVRQKFDRWYERHKGKKESIDNYKNSVITFLNPNKTYKWKQKK